ncbi:hypothetical protein JYK22_20110, partial [Nonomuraea sp. RK-328]|nr:hypothetical protein [Nonomuraea sp. RK-328]
VGGVPVGHGRRRLGTRGRARLMSGWLIPLVYVAALVYTERKTATALRNTDLVEPGDWGDGIMLRFVGFMVGVVWLAVLVTGRLPATDHEIRMQLADREMRLAQRDQRIAQLERELGIRP